MSKINECMLTTVDNPFSPFTQFDDWFKFDCEHDYGTCEFLAHFVFTSDSLSDAENVWVMEQAIDQIIQYDPRKIYKKVYESDYTPSS